ncbi:MAG: hypothetical protein R2710_27440 [Acidimicrobiales bacterium]
MPVARLVAPALFAAAALVAAGCSEEAQLDFQQENADGFMAGCASTTDDPVIQVELCQCVIDTAQVRLRFTEFEEMEAELKAEVPEGEPPPPLPPELVEIVAECVIEVGEL